MLVFKDGVWYKGYLYSKRLKSNVWSKPKIKLRRVENSKVLKIVDYLNSANLWSMNRDSLNIHERRNKDGSIEKLSVYDLDNDRFEIFDKNRFVIIESYAPEYFLEELPENKILEHFIKVRDWFTVNYEAL
ncbi:hypothetical protein SNE25_02475 [Mucilaginibacter sabulilitoris]|uniref:Uncharacterized protein n=1 Tax=Mucilaginibacter sabulilitoris TaxID=1173583 RepID=A0ABZ0TNM9_9SPHI|nr:hypothetical protein [Mucilaginibacter sabulilitoris]WPU94386.1 hypothetical protein SNE25_02475 [Mucilaginibacter sabulilitoris]